MRWSIAIAACGLSARASACPPPSADLDPDLRCGLAALVATEDIVTCIDDSDTYGPLIPPPAPEAAATADVRHESREPPASSLLAIALLLALLAYAKPREDLV